MYCCVSQCSHCIIWSLHLIILIHTSTWYMQFLMCTFYEIWLLSLILVHVLKGWFDKNNTQNKKKTIWNYLCFFLLKVTYKMECGLGLWEIYGFCFLLELWLGALSHTAAFRDNISRKHYPTTNPIKLEEIYSFLIKLYRCFTDPISRPWYSFIHSNGMVL